MERFSPDLVHCDGRNSNYFELDACMVATLDLVGFGFTLFQWHRELATCSALNFSIDCCITRDANSDMVSSTE